LMAVELRNAIAGALERTLPATLLFKYPALEGLTEFVMEQVGGDTPAPAPPPEATDAEADSVAAMSDEEAKALLAQELEFLSVSSSPEDSGS
jgi:mycoketide-CoA synthase